MKVMVLGGDGFCGWPASLRLSAAGHEVVIVDNLSRRRIDDELGSYSLTPISPIETRISAWAAATQKRIEFVNLDIATDYSGFLSLLAKERPDSIVHFAEQRAAPYSMKSAAHKRYTVTNNVNGTHNVLCAIVESGLETSLVHLGTMGVYGYKGEAEIPEGYLQVRVKAKDGAWNDREILHPADPGSVYHMTKTLDQLIFLFYNKNDKIRITDLHQGIVWGTNTAETLLDPRLVNRFDYDGEYGTVLNRFLVQAAVGHPLTVYGAGGQTRAFIHIRDSVECIRIAVENPPEPHAKVRIFNQMTEVFKVRDLADLISKLTGAPIGNTSNPRQEIEEHELAVKSVGLRSLGLMPTTLQSGLLEEILDVAKQYSSRVDLTKIATHSFWNSSRKAAASDAVNRGGGKSPASKVAKAGQ